MREGNEQDAESACKSLRWDGRSGYANVGKRCWVGASGAHQSVVHKWCRPRIPHPSSRCVYIKCIIFCSYTYIIYAYFNLRMRRKSVVGCRSSHHRELPSVRPPVMTGAGSSSQMPSSVSINLGTGKSGGHDRRTDRRQFPWRAQAVSRGYLP